MKIAIGNDHAGTDYKNTISNYLQSEGYEVINYGTDSEESVDYPDFVHPVADDVENAKVDFGIIICGSGNGANMTANKHQKVRSALCWTKEITARFTSEPQALEMVKTFLTTKFEGGRHQRRVEKIACS